MSSTEGEENVGLSKLIQNASKWQIFAAFVTILAVRWIARAIHRVYFHPLAKFPGYKLDAATRIPQHIATWKGEWYKRIAESHRKYGYVVRIAPDELSFIDPEAWKDVYGHGTKGTRGSAPHKTWERYSATLEKSVSLVSAQKDDHTRIRRIFASAFSDRALKQQEPLFMKYANLLVEKLSAGIREDPERKFDMVKMFNFTTFDVMGDLTFGEPLQMLNNAEYAPWVKVIFSLIKTGYRMSALRHYPIMRMIMGILIPPSAMKKRMVHLEYAEERVAKRLDKGRKEEGVDLWDLVLSQPEGKGLTHAEMNANASLFMTAGTETTATLLSGLTYRLLENPGAMKKLTKEVRETFSSSQDMSIEAVAQLPYLNACIKEALRMYPPIAVALPRTTPPDGSTVCGQYVPGGYIIGIAQRVMFTSERNFKDPLSFVPERWLGDKRYDGDQRACVQPFSVGSRDCIGKNMAYHEMRLIMASLLHAFDLQLCPESEDWANQKIFMLWEKKPLICKLRPVK
ncbi:cytochrome P450 [Byssothecium circinans]|uniref:Cytochrome P450 n=1 Tax=Byssothecium circinans TaxID=147558 RepID=A0A6A5UA53_9PLEO|nr:cytochrome P450 [Byssothecium circinans]